MTKPISLGIARQQLADAIAKSQSPIPAPLNVSPWIAMSALQKAIRRGREDIALPAAATLLTVSPERLWRRCGGIAFEDIGLADLETVSLVTAALAGKRFRATLGGEWPVASYIVSRMAQARKCRAADDLLMSVELHPAYQRVRDQLASASTQELLDIVIGPGVLSERAIALWYAVGTERHSSTRLRYRKGEPKIAFEFLSRSGYSTALVEIASAAFWKNREVLCPLVVLLSDQGLTGSTEIADDDMLEEVTIRGVPGWAYDTYTREGKAAFQTFLQGSSDTARWVRTHIAPTRQVGFLGGLVFRVEGGLVRRRLRWPTADELRRLVDIECHGPGCPDATEVLALMRGDIGQLNAVRADVC